MPNIPRTNQFYPSVPISELSDLYSKGNQQINNQRIFIISYLPKALRISSKYPFNNKYALYIENTTVVDTISWSYTLFLNGETVNNNTFINVLSNTNEPEYIIQFFNDITDTLNIPLFDKLKISCHVRLGTQEVTLALDHTFVKSIDTIILPSADEINGMSVPFSGNPNSANYVLNHVKDYLQPGLITWNNAIVEIGALENDTLLKIVTGILYHNTLITQNESQLSFYIDIDQYSNIDLKAFLNDNTEHNGNYFNGICKIPLHILSDIFILLSQVPDFSKIDSGAGNPIYNIIRDNGIFTYNDLEGDVLRTVPQQIQDSKLRLTNDIPRFVELYNLTLFPKSAIKLVAVLVKYLFECSIKNNCNECKGKQIQWPTLTLDGLKDHQEFLKNILTHYFREPSNKIESFSQEAKKTTTFVWSPGVYSILNVAPRIVKAYFANKIVKKIGTDYVFDFEKIDNVSIRVDETGVALPVQPNYDKALGSQVYLIVETLYYRGNSLNIGVQPINNLLSGNTNSINLATGRDFTNYVSDIIRTIGNYDDLRNNNNADFSILEKEYFNIDHKDKVIVKLRLKPDTLTTFNNWANTLGTNDIKLRIAAQFSDNKPAIFGNDVANTRVADFFLSLDDKYQFAQFRVVNQIIFEIYHINSNWNFLNNGIRFIGKIFNSFIYNLADNQIQNRIVAYHFYDNLDNEHYFGEFNINKTNWINTARYNNSPYPDAFAYLIHPFRPISNWYNIRFPGNVVDRFIADLNYSYSNNLNDWISILDTNQPTPRFHIDITCFAAILGAIATNKIQNLGYNGFSNALGQSVGGSVSHVNGIRGDLRYLRIDNTGAKVLLNDAGFDFVRQNLFNDSLWEYGWSKHTNAQSIVDEFMLSENFIRNGVQVRVNHTDTLNNSQHNDHIHLQGFSFDIIHDLIN